MVKVKWGTLLLINSMLFQCPDMPRTYHVTRHVSHTTWLSFKFHVRKHYVLCFFLKNYHSDMTTLLDASRSWALNVLSRACRKLVDH